MSVQLTGAAIPAVTVVVPLFNKAATIERCLHSVFGQSFRDFEIIVVDDGSTDDGPERARRLGDPRVVLHRQKNAGPGAARNAGLKLARAPLITFLDADDEWLPGLLKTAVAKLVAHPDCGAFAANYVREPTGTDRWADLPTYSEGPWRWRASLPRREVKNIHHAFHQCTAVYRTDIVRALGGFYENRCTMGEDVPLWLKVLLNHSIYRHATPLGRYQMADSELGIAARGNDLPIEPVYTDQGVVWDAAPPELAKQLSWWLADTAAATIFMQLERGNYARAREMLRLVPWMRQRDVLRYMVRVTVPGLWVWLRAVKRAMVASQLVNNASV